jgi:hypothetical protein
MKNTLVIVLITIAFNMKAQNILQFENNIKLKISIVEFDRDNHIVDTCYFENQPYYCKIDQMSWFGSDMGMELPKYELKEIVLLNNDEIIPLDVSKMFNPAFNTTISKGQFEVKLINNQIEIHGWFSDGAGTYCAEWLVINGTSNRTLLSNSETDCFE